MTIFDFASSPSTPTASTSFASTSTHRSLRGIAVVQLHDELWRVTRPTGEVLGYIEQYTERAGRKYRVKRMIVLQKRFVVIGEFWSMDDAIDCLRF